MTNSEGADRASADRVDIARSIAPIYEAIENYYTAKISKHGATPLGVDWTCTATQELRFVQLLKVCDFSAPFSLNDLGCGYGALLAYLSKRHSTARIDYLGIDLSAGMISHARRLYSHRPNTGFAIGRTSPRVADYSLASGIFNVKLRHGVEAWSRVVAQTLLDMKEGSRRGFSVNFMLAEASDDARNEMLYRVIPDRWTRFCQDQFDCSINTIANYGMREFTLLVHLPNAEVPDGKD